MVRVNWKAACRTAIWSHAQCLTVKSVIHRIASSKMCHYISALFFSRQSTHWKERRTYPTALCSLWLQLTSVERAWIPSLVAICPPGDSQEYISEKPRNRSHTRDYLDPVPPGFLFPKLLSGTHWWATKTFQKGDQLGEVHLLSQELCPSSLLPLHFLRSCLIKRQVLAHH